MSDPVTTKRAIEMVKDKKRLDWLEHNGDKLWFSFGQWMIFGSSFDDIRDAIDEAMRREMETQPK